MRTASDERGRALGCSDSVAGITGLNGIVAGAVALRISDESKGKKSNESEHVNASGVHKSEIRL